MPPRGRYGASPPTFSPPPLDPWMIRILGSLFGLYALELILYAVGAPVRLLAWAPFGQGFLPWQPLTHFLVQGPGNVFGVVIGLLVLYLLLPSLRASVAPSQRLELLGALAGGGVAMALLVDAVGLGSGVALGWSSLLTGLFVVFGLANPGATINLYFVLPIRAVWFAWGTLAIATLGFLASLSGGGSLGAAEYLGTAVGAFAWWRLRGGAPPPARRKRGGKGRRQSSPRFTVLPGGQDDVVH